MSSDIKLPETLRFLKTGWWAVHLTGIAASGVLLYLALKNDDDLGF